MDRAERWQDSVAHALVEVGATVLNPRRENWDPTARAEASDPRFREQVEWELGALEAADLILMYFAPNTRSPITLLEMGLFGRSTRLVVCCPDGFWRKGNVDIVCERYGIPQAPDLEALTDAGRDYVASFSPAPS